MAQAHCVQAGLLQGLQAKYVPHYCTLMCLSAGVLHWWHSLLCCIGYRFGRILGGFDIPGVSWLTHIVWNSFQRLVATASTEVQQLHVLSEGQRTCPHHWLATSPAGGGRQNPGSQDLLLLGQRCCLVARHTRWKKSNSSCRRIGYQPTAAMHIRRQPVLLLDNKTEARLCARHACKAATHTTHLQTQPRCRQSGLLACVIACMGSTLQSLKLSDSDSHAPDEPEGKPDPKHNQAQARGLPQGWVEIASVTTTANTLTRLKQLARQHTASTALLTAQSACSTCWQPTLTGSSMRLHSGVHQPCCTRSGAGTPTNELAALHIQSSGALLLQPLLRPGAVCTAMVHSPVVYWRAAPVLASQADHGVTGWRHITSRCLRGTPQIMVQCEPLRTDEHNGITKNRPAVGGSQSVECCCRGTQHQPSLCLPGRLRLSAGHQYQTAATTKAVAAHNPLLPAAPLLQCAHTHTHARPEGTLLVGITLSAAAVKAPALCQAAPTC